MKVKVKSLGRVRVFATPWTAAYQAPPSMGFSRQEYWSGLPLPSPPWPLVSTKCPFHSVPHLWQSKLFPDVPKWTVRATVWEQAQSRFPCHMAGILFSFSPQLEWWLLVNISWPTHLKMDSTPIPLPCFSFHILSAAFLCLFLWPPLVLGPHKYELYGGRVLVRRFLHRASSSPPSSPPLRRAPMPDTVTVPRAPLGTLHQWWNWRVSCRNSPQHAS